MKRLVSLGFVFLAALAIAQQSGKNWLVPILGKSKAVVEKTLGKPKTSEGEADMAECTYTRKGLKKVTVLYLDGKMANLSIQLAKQPKDWKAALTLVGVPTAGVTVAKSNMKDQGEDIPGKFLYEFKGIKGMPKGWTGQYTERIAADASPTGEEITASLQFFSSASP